MGLGQENTIRVDVRSELDEKLYVNPLRRYDWKRTSENYKIVDDNERS